MSVEQARGDVQPTPPGKLTFLTVATIRGGAEEWLLQCAEHALRSSWDVTVALPRGAGTDSLAASLAEVGAAVHPLSLHYTRSRPRSARLRRPLAFLALLGATLRVVEERRGIFVVNAGLPRQGLAVLIGLAVRRAPTLVVFHLTRRHSRVGIIHRRVYAWARRREQRWQTVSKGAQADLCSAFGVKAEHVDVVPNGIRLDRFAPLLSSEERERARRAIGVPTDAPVLITVAALRTVKGFADLVAAAPAVLNRHPDATFLWVGEGPDEEVSKALVSDRRLEGHVRLLGRREDVPSLLALADVFVFPSHAEGYPLAVLEAMAAGLPVVAAAAPGTTELITDSVDGLLFPVADRAAMAGAICQVLDSPEIGSRLASAARGKVGTWTIEDAFSATFKNLPEPRYGRPWVSPRPFRKRTRRRAGQPPI